MTKKETKIKKLTLKQQLIEKDEEIIGLNKEIYGLKDKNIKLLAEFDNFQRRTFDEAEKNRKYDGIHLLKKIIPVFDDIDRAASIEEEGNIESLSEAAKMIKSKLVNILKQESILSIDSINKSFDPTFHEALLEQNSDTVEKGKILEEYEKGYKYHDKIIRHAKVVVSKGKE